MLVLRFFCIGNQAFLIEFHLNNFITLYINIILAENRVYTTSFYRNRPKVLETAEELKAMYTCCHR